MMNTNNLEEPKLTYAILKSSNRLVHIDKVESGQNCNCICPECYKPLIAKKGDVRQHHFAHNENSNCSGGIMSAIHVLAEQIIYDEKSVMFPAYNKGKRIKAKRCLFDDVIVEQRLERSDLQADVVGITRDENHEVKWNIEIFYTHEVDNKKKKKIYESNINCLEIDVREQELDEDSLKKFLLHSDQCREWINNPEYERIIYELKNCKIKAITRILSGKEGITLPPYQKDGINEKHILLSEVKTTYASKDGRLSIVEGYFEDKKYVFYIGYRKSLINIEPSKECRELKLFVDRIKDFSNQNLKIEWLYNPEHIENKNKLEALKKEFDFKQINVLECEKCELYSRNNLCIYHKGIMKDFGVDWVLCTR